MRRILPTVVSPDFLDFLIFIWWFFGASQYPTDNQCHCVCVYKYPLPVWHHCQASLSFGMEYMWEPPEANYVKINVHCCTVALPLPNGNSNGVGVIVRNSAGQEIWSAAGPMPGKTKLQATLWGIYHGALNCHQLEEWKTHIESDHWGAVEAISFQEEFLQQEDIQEVLRLFNTLHANHFQVDTTKRTITRIPVMQNGTAAYLARFGMKNLSSFTETPGSFGEKQFMIERDMGLMLSLAPLANFDMGEVIDAEDTLESASDLSLNSDHLVEDSCFKMLLHLPARLCNLISSWWF